jgi:GT2 family glycosyltransferase/glycosyltransferase involved in cell wall biosynthesis
VPRWSVITAVHDPEPAHLEACLASVRAQRLGRDGVDVEHVVVDDASTRPQVLELLRAAARSDPDLRLIERATNGGIVAASSDALDAATGELIALLDHDDVLEPDALAAMEAALAGADVAYSDHDLILPDGRHVAPYYKPDFSPEQLRSQNYVLHLLTARRSAIDAVGGFRAGFDGAQDHDLLLRLSEHTDRIAHVPRVLYHWRQAPDSVASDTGNKPWAFEAGRRAVAEHCERVGIDATVEAGPAPGTYRVRRRPRATPRVSVVIPTRGGSRRVWGVERCFVFEAVRSMIEQATYPDLEYVVVHDDVTPGPVLEALRRIGGDAMVLVDYDRPFNFSEKINLGVAAASGDLVLILNDDTELITPDAIETMVAHLEDDSVGMVGPKLLFADGTVQDGGHVYNRHLLPGLVGWHGESMGPWQLRPLAVEREVSGVTAAAAMVRRDLFDQVGGFDESMPVNFNDVDFSLKIRATGRRIVWTPHASWYHFESQTRPPTATPAEFDAIEARWAHEIAHDPYYNPNFASYRSDWVERPLRSGEPMIEPEATTGQWVRQRLFGSGLADDRSRLARVRMLVLGAALVGYTWAARSVVPEGPSSVEGVVFTVVPLVVVLALVSMAASRRRWVLVAGLVVAIAPSVLAQIAAGRRHALLTAVAVIVGLAAGPVGRRSRAVAAYGAGAGAFVGLVSWWAVTPVRAGGVDPSWSVVVGSAGRHLEAAVGSLAPFGTASPVTATLAWWVAAGLVAGMVVVGRRAIFLLAPFGAWVLVVGWAIVLERFRGPVDAADGMWLVAGAVVFAAARVEVPPRLGRRVAIGVTLAAAWAWTAAVAALVRAVADDAVEPAAWSRWRSWGSLVDGRTASVLLPVAVLAGVAVVAFAASIATRSRDPRGVNVVGYHTITAGLGERTRELTESLRAVGVPVAAYDLEVVSARDGAALAQPDERYDTTVVVAPAFEVPLAARAHPELFAGRRLIAGYWFWELDEIPETHQPGLDLVDEVWAPTTFVRDAYRSATLLPVRHLPLAIPEPEVAPLGRAELGLADDEFVVLVSFSHLSVMERKNPLGAIEAFRRAFPESGPHRARLVIKSINADLKPDDARRLRTAAAVDARIGIRTERVDHADLMALVRVSDVFLSLHRSEGLGLQIADAMWLGTAVVATDFGGSTDLLDAGCAELVPASRIGVCHGDGAYPETMTWADPDLDVAAAALRALADDPDRRRRIATAARERVAAFGDRAAAAASVARLARCPTRR